MSAVMRPQASPTDGMRLVSTVNQNREQNRYLFFAGNVLDPDRVFNTEHLRGTGGGDEIHTHCLRRSTGHFLPRARLMPLEVWTEAMPPEYIGDGAERDTVRIESAMTPENLEMKSRRPGFLIGSPLTHVKFYPGDEIRFVLKANEGKGLTEVRALVGAPWYERDGEGNEDLRKPGPAQFLNRDFFPSLPPVTLSGLREWIDKAAGMSELHRDVASDMFASCEQFKRWAEARLAAEHVLLRQRVSHQHTHTYTPIARVLLDQLEMKPQDSLFESAAGLSEEKVAEIMARFGGQQNMTPEFIAQIVGQVTTSILAAQATQTPAEQQPSGARGHAPFEHDSAPPPPKPQPPKQERK